MSTKKESSEPEEIELRKIYLKVNDLSYKDDSLVVDLVRFLQEKLASIQIERNGNELEISAPLSMPKKTIKLRIRKFLYKNNLKENFRPISYKIDEKDGYEIHEKKQVEFTYY